MLNGADYAFQPIISMHSGACLGVEVLLRNYRACGFNAIGEVFDDAFDHGVLHDVDLRLREMAVGKFARSGFAPGVRLFFNMDPRVLDAPDYRHGATVEILERHGLDPTSFCIEVSERFQADGW